MWPQPCKKIRLDAVPRAASRGRTRAHSKDKGQKQTVVGWSAGGGSLEKQGAESEGPNGSLEESLEPFTPKTNTESTEKQDCPFHVLEGENRF